MTLPCLKNMSAFSDFAAFAGKSGKKVTFVAPRSTDVFASYLPDIYSNERANAVWDKFSALCGDYASITQGAAAPRSPDSMSGLEPTITGQHRELILHIPRLRKSLIMRRRRRTFGAERFSDTFTARRIQKRANIRKARQRRFIPISEG